jgi:hypothetical protein
MVGCCVFRPLHCPPPTVIFSPTIMSCAVIDAVNGMAWVNFQHSVDATLFAAHLGSRGLVLKYNLVIKNYYLKVRGLNEQSFPHVTSRVFPKRRSDRYTPGLHGCPSAILIGACNPEPIVSGCTSMSRLSSLAGLSLLLTLLV